MMRLNATFWLCLAAGAAHAGPDCPGSVVRIVREGTQPGFERLDDGGSGVVVSAGKGRSLVVTNEHILDHGRGEVFVYSVTGWWGPAKVLRFSDGADLAVLLVDKELPAAELADPKRGADVTLFGFPHGVTRPRAKAGRVVGFDGTYRGSPVLITSVASEDGDSGGGQFDKDGRLVALSAARGGWTVPASEIKSLLERVK